MFGIAKVWVHISKPYVKCFINLPDNRTVDAFWFKPTATQIKYNKQKCLSEECFCVCDTDNCYQTQYIFTARWRHNFPHT